MPSPRAFLCAVLALLPSALRAEHGDSDHELHDRLQRGIDLIAKSCPTPGPLGTCVEFRKVTLPCPEFPATGSAEPSPLVPMEIARAHARDAGRVREAGKLLATATIGRTVDLARQDARGNPERGMALENTVALARIHAMAPLLDTFLAQVAPSLDLVRPAPLPTETATCARAWLDGNQATARALLEGYASALGNAGAGVATTALARITLVLDKWSQGLDALDRASHACANSPAGANSRPISDLAKQAAEACVRMGNHAGIGGTDLAYCRYVHLSHRPFDAKSAPASTGDHPLGVRELPSSEHASIAPQHEGHRCMAALRKGGSTARRYQDALDRRVRQGRDVDLPAVIAATLARFGLPPSP